MKFYWIFLFGCLATVKGAVVFTEQTFRSCESNEWIITNTTMIFVNDTKEIVSNITFNTCKNCPIYTIHIVIDDCTNDTNCQGQPQVSIDKIDCNSDNLTDIEMDACRVAQEVAKLEKEREWLTFRYGLLYGNEFYNLKFCINMGKLQYSNSDENDSSDFSESSLSNETNSSNAFNGSSESNGSDEWQELGGHNSKEHNSKEHHSKEHNSKEHNSKEKSN